MAVKDDAGRSLLVVAQLAVLIGVEQIENGMEGGGFIAVGEGQGPHGGRVAAVEIAGQPRFAMHEIAGVDMSTEEADHDQWRVRVARSV
jgi:hypothetical protein